MHQNVQLFATWHQVVPLTEYVCQYLQLTCTDSSSCVDALMGQVANQMVELCTIQTEHEQEVVSPWMSQLQLAILHNCLSQQVDDNDTSNFKCTLIIASTVIGLVVASSKVLVLPFFSLQDTQFSDLCSRNLVTPCFNIFGLKINFFLEFRSIKQLKMTKKEK